MARRIVYRQAARNDLKAIHDWIAERGSPGTALSYIGRVQAACSRLADFPDRGSPRDDLEPGLRTIVFERRATIYYLVEREAVRIVRILHAGRDARREFGRR